MVQSDLPCSPYSGLSVECEGASFLIFVHENLQARLRGPGLRYLTVLVESRVTGDDVRGLPAVINSLSGMMK